VPAFYFALNLNVRISSAGFTMLVKPTDNFFLEFPRRDGNCTAMICAWNLPQGDGRVVNFDQARMTDRDIRINLAVNQEHWNPTVRDRLLWGGIS
jgi:hypothetical protein